MIIFAPRKAKLKEEKNQDANFSLLIKNLNPLLKNRFRIWIPKLGGFRIRIANPNFKSCNSFHLEQGEKY